MQTFIICLVYKVCALISDIGACAFMWGIRVLKWLGYGSLLVKVSSWREIRALFVLTQGVAKKALPAPPNHFFLRESYFSTMYIYFLKLPYFWSTKR